MDDRPWTIAQRPWTIDYGQRIASGGFPIVTLRFEKFPKEKRFNLTDQFNRSSDSVALNISEGSIGQTDREQTK